MLAILKCCLRYHDGEVSRRARIAAEEYFAAFDATFTRCDAGDATDGVIR